jgi:enterochelin esterase-like enzyme
MKCAGRVRLAAVLAVALALTGCGADAPGTRFITASTAAASTAAFSTAPPWLRDGYRKTPPGHGVWTQTTLSGARTGYKLPAWIYVPAAYFHPQQQTRRFPVVILLAGFPGAIENWARQGGMLPILDQMMASGQLPPMILVSVTQNPQPDRDSECVNAVGGAQVDTYLALDVPEAVAAQLPVATDRTNWSAMGYSTGGYCAVDLALRHPDRFAAAISLDGYFTPATDNTTGDLFKADQAARRSFTPMVTIHDRRPFPEYFYLVVGDAEARSKKDAAAFAAAVHPPDGVTVADIPGVHNWTTWNHALPAALTWLAAH